MRVSRVALVIAACSKLSVDLQLVIKIGSYVVKMGTKNLITYVYRTIYTLDFILSLFTLNQSTRNCMLAGAMY